MNFIEQIAKPIAAELMELTASGRAKFKFPDDVNGDTYDRAMSAARMVLKAMREPTDAMLKAEMDLGGYGHGDGECYRADPREVWQAMIDAELATAPAA
jgi:hypothetical protein